jgi:pilus assembly protein CpaF
MSSGDMYARTFRKHAKKKKDEAAASAAPVASFNYGGQGGAMDDNAPDADIGAEHGDKVLGALLDDPIIARLMADESINDILINGPNTIYVEQHGKLHMLSEHLSSEAAVFKLAEEIAAQTGKHINLRRPLLDTRLSDGSRVNIIAPPLSIDGTTISIRKFANKAITLDAMAINGNMSSQLCEFLKVCAVCRLNTIISGGTGSGKTTLLNAISQYIGEDERVVTIEDAAELRMQQPHVVRLETRPYNAGEINRDEEVTMRDLVRNALRMRPDRIIIGEVRGSEAFDLMQAMNTGHEGSLSTIHANHPRDALSRITNMVNMANLGVPVSAIRGQIASSINLIIQISRMRDGKRRISYVSEIVGMEADVVTMQDLFVFRQSGEGKKGDLQGTYEWTGIMPRFLRRAEYYDQGTKLSQILGVKIKID